MPNSNQSLLPNPRLHAQFLDSPVPGRVCMPPSTTGATEVKRHPAYIICTESKHKVERGPSNRVAVLTYFQTARSIFTLLNYLLVPIICVVLILARHSRIQQGSMQKDVGHFHNVKS